MEQRLRGKRLRDRNKERSGQGNNLFESESSPSTWRCRSRS